MEPSRSCRFMPTWSICFPLLQASWKLNMEPALLLGCTSMQAGVKAWWCWAKPCWTNSLQMESACWLTGTELAWMASTVDFYTSPMDALMPGGWDIHKHPCLSGQWAAHVEIPLLFCFGGGSGLFVYPLEV